jgi:hypothetical protein
MRVLNVWMATTLQFSSDAQVLLTERHYTSTPAERAGQLVVGGGPAVMSATTLSHIQVQAGHGTTAALSCQVTHACTGPCMGPMHDIACPW